MLSNAVMARLAAVCAATPPLDLLFRHCARFPRLLYLEPEPATGLAALTQKILLEWPEVPPYGGVHESVAPHLTVAHGVDETMMDEIEADISRRLPFNARVTEAALFVFDGARWRQRASLPLVAVSLQCAAPPRLRQCGGTLGGVAQERAESRRPRRSVTPAPT